MKFDTGQPAYRRLRSIIAERTSSIVAWVGAGLSVPAGLPTWKGLLGALLEEYEGKVSTMTDEAKEEAEGVIKTVNKEENLWRGFRILKEKMGKETYRQKVREELDVSDSVDPPINYKRLWNIGISGLVNMNIDRLATRAYVRTRNKEPIEYTGQNIKNCIGALRSPNPFILNIHGSVNNYKSWVFTEDAINWLMNNDVYKDVIKNILLSRTVVFIGLTADDISVGGHLRRVSEKFDVGGHFWITNRTDKETDNWAEDVGLRVIRYHSVDGDHSGLDHFFDDLVNYVPQDEEAEPIEPSLEPDQDSQDLPEPAILAQKSPETIRKVLNREAKKILSSGEGKYEKYEDFFDRYDRCIYNAWYTTDDSPNNNLMDYELISKIESGAFGVVYRAKDEQENVYAIKKLKQEVRNKGKMLQGFRRGVKSHKILSNKNVDGIVRYYSAFEIPAFVVMEWIDGPTIKEAVESRYIDSWGEILEITKKLSGIVKSAHELPERVLHRDIRPANVMMKNYYKDPEDYKIVVLDFDLSWHKGAIEESIKSGHAYVGYLAPEQISTEPEYSTRSAAVDSYGIGMTMYYLLSRRDPSPMENKHSTWKKKLLEFANERSCQTWKSAPKRFARVIYNCTKQRQPERWDMTQVYNEIERIQNAVSGRYDITHAELIAEELAERCGAFPYDWNSEKMRAEISLPSGIDIHIEPQEVDSEVDMYMRWSSSGREETKNIGKYMGEAIDQMISMMKSDGWNVKNVSKESMSFSLRMACSSNAIVRDISRKSNTLREAVDIARFN